MAQRSTIRVKSSSSVQRSTLRYQLIAAKYNKIWTPAQQLWQWFAVVTNSVMPTVASCMLVRAAVLAMKEFIVMSARIMSSPVMPSVADICALNAGKGG